MDKKLIILAISKDSLKQRISYFADKKNIPKPTPQKVSEFANILLDSHAHEIDKLDLHDYFTRLWERYTNKVFGVPTDLGTALTITQQGDSFFDELWQFLESQIKTDTEERKCANCNGTGTITIEHEVENDQVELDEIECSMCKGTGVKSKTDKEEKR